MKMSQKSDNLPRITPRNNQKFFQFLKQIRKLRRGKHLKKKWVCFWVFEYVWVKILSFFLILALQMWMGLEVWARLKLSKRKNRFGCYLPWQCILGWSDLKLFVANYNCRCLNRSIGLLSVEFWESGKFGPILILKVLRFWWNFQGLYILGPLKTNPLSVFR
jgi:hypothetical protein